MNLHLYFLLVLALASWNLPASELSSSPYPSQDSREIKALSEDEVKGLLEGKGMGYAKAAELNGYPGPAHVLALSEELGLSTEQQAQTRTIFEQMESRAKALGGDLVEAEADLDAAFRSREITEELLSDKLERIGILQGELRNVHLAAHLEQTRVLTRDQIVQYMRLRGYRGTAHGSHHEDH